MEGQTIIRYRTGSTIATGGEVTQDGEYTLHTFTESGVFTVNPQVPRRPTLWQRFWSWLTR